MSQNYVVEFEKYLRKLEADREALLEAARQVVAEFDPLDQFVSAPKPIANLKTAIAKAEGRE